MKSPLTGRTAFAIPQSLGTVYLFLNTTYGVLQTPLLTGHPLQLLILAGLPLQLLILAGHPLQLLILLA